MGKKKTNKIQKEKYLGQAPLHFHLKVAQQVGPDRLDLIFFKKIRYVSSVIPQSTLDYSNNLLKLKPDYVVHGDDWKVGFQKNIRKKLLYLKFNLPEISNCTSKTKLI